MGTRITALSDPQWRQSFKRLQRSWFRLECLQHYDVGYEADRMRAFHAGEPVDLTPGPWQEMIRRHREAGRVLQRVHIVEEPITPYIAFELAYYPRNAAAGEDIRIIATPASQWPEGLPRHDFWLLDDDELWVMEYDNNGRFRNAERIEDPKTVAQHLTWKQQALAAAVPLSDYLAVSASQLHRVP